jgi:hypothetical protein
MTELRIGDAEREAAVAALGEHYAQGRITKEEYDERSEAAMSARTRADLRPLFADLAAPEPPRAARPAYRPTRPPWLPGIVVPVLLVLVGLTVLTHLPLILFGLAVWFFLIRPRWHRMGWQRTGWHQHQRSWR